MGTGIVYFQPRRFLFVLYIIIFLSFSFCDCDDYDDKDNEIKIRIVDSFPITQMPAVLAIDNSLTVLLSDSECARLALLRDPLYFAVCRGAGL
jgi:hypothetical protein